MPDSDASFAGEIHAAGHLRVLLPVALPAALDYLAPAEMTPPAPGSFVRVPLAARNLVGVVWEGTGCEVPAERLKPVLDILPVPPLRPELRRFVERVAAYTMTPPGMVLRMAMSVPEALQPPRSRRLCAATPAGLAALAESPLTPARRRVLGALIEGQQLPAAELARAAGCGAGVVRELAATGFIEE